MIKKDSQNVFSVMATKITNDFLQSIIETIENVEETYVTDRIDHNGEHQQKEFMFEPSEMKENIIRKIKEEFNYKK